MDDRRSPPRHPGCGCRCEATEEQQQRAPTAVPCRDRPRGRGGGRANRVSRRRQDPRRRHRHGGGLGGSRGHSGRRGDGGRRGRRDPGYRRPGGGSRRLRGLGGLGAAHHSGPGRRSGPGAAGPLRGRSFRRGNLHGRKRARADGPLLGADGGRRRQRHRQLGRDHGGGRCERGIGVDAYRRRPRSSRGRHGRRLRDGLLGRRGRRRPGREQAERVDVPVRLGGDADAEVDVRRPGDGVGAFTRDPDDSTLLDGAAASDAHRAELEERDRVAVRGLDRQRSASARDGARERDGARAGRPHLGADGRAEVDAAVLTARVRIG